MIFKCILCATLVAILQTVIAVPKDFIMVFPPRRRNSKCSRHLHIKNEPGISEITSTTSGPEAISVPCGYEKFDNSYYKYHREPKEFHEARATCDAEGSYLAVVNSEEESAYLIKLMSRYPPDGLNDVQRKDFMLIGFHDLFKKDEYVTIQGHNLATTGFMRWAPGQPNNSGKENCGSMHRQSGGLNNFPCDIPSPFVCELTPDPCITK